MSKTFVSTLLSALAFVASVAAAAEKPNPDVVARGRYIVMVGGCNDCHTAGFAANAGKVPESERLTGDRVGWQGAWGTTYAPNLRLRVGAMDLPTWKRYAKSVTTRPPMCIGLSTR